MDVAFLTTMPPAPKRVRENHRSDTARRSCAANALPCARINNLARALFIFAALLHASTVCAQADAPGEYQLKAAFLFNFAKFVQWPANSFTSPQSEFQICIVGDDPFGKSIDQVLQGKSIAEHPVVILRCKSVSEITHCQIVFVSSSERKRLPEIFSSLKGTNALVVGETDGFALSGGAVQFTLEDQRVHFIINVDAAERAGLQVSSKLLALAKVLREAPVSRKS